MSFDYFVGAMACRVCGRESAADERTNMQTKIRARPRRENLGVGSRADVDAAALLRADYVQLRPPRAGEYRLLQSWDCPSCGNPTNWAAIIIRDGVVRSVAATTLDRAALASADFIAEEDGRNLASRMTGRPSAEFWGDGLRDFLLSRL